MLSHGDLHTSPESYLVDTWKEVEQSGTLHVEIYDGNIYLMFCSFSEYLQDYCLKFYMKEQTGVKAPRGFVLHLCLMINPFRSVFVPSGETSMLAVNGI